MDRRLINYLPYQVRQFQEYKGIAAGEQPEFELVWNYWQEVFDSQFIDTAGGYGLSRWEKMLHIIPKTSDTLESRRIKIKTRQNSFTPWTLTWLKKWLTDICGTEGHRETLSDYTLEIWLDSATLYKANTSAVQIMEILEDIIPENLCWKIISALEMSSTIHTGSSVGMQTERPIPADTAPPSATAILRAGGVVTMIAPPFYPNNEER